MAENDLFIGEWLFINILGRKGSCTTTAILGKNYKLYCLKKPD